MRAVVIGAGLAGLSLAIALRKVGIDVTLYERAPELTEVGAGISLWANALRALDYLGVGDTVRERSVTMTRSEMRIDEGRRVALSFDARAVAARIGAPDLVRVLHRAELVDALASRVPAASIHFGSEAIEIDTGGRRPRVRFANSHSDEADVIVGADGIHSVVRKAIAGPEPPRYSGYTCWRGICARPSALPVGHGGEWWGRGKRLGLATLSGDRVYWFAVQNAPPGMPVAHNRQHLLDTFAGWAQPSAELFETTEERQIIRGDIIDRPPRTTWSTGAVGLIGDAAHPTTPNLGQGGCLAIEDAIVLARHLSRVSNPADALDAFTRERLRRTSGITNESWWIGRVAQMEGRVASGIRDVTIGVVGKLMGPSGMVRHVRFDVGPLPAISSSPSQGPSASG